VSWLQLLLMLLLSIVSHSLVVWSRLLRCPMSNNLEDGALIIKPLGQPEVFFLNAVVLLFPVDVMKSLLALLVMGLSWQYLLDRRNCSHRKHSMAGFLLDQVGPFRSDAVDFLLQLLVFSEYLLILPVLFKLLMRHPVLLICALLDVTSLHSLEREILGLVLRKHIRIEGWLSHLVNIFLYFVEPVQMDLLGNEFVVDFGHVLIVKPVGRLACLLDELSFGLGRNSCIQVVSRL